MKKLTLAMVVLMAMVAIAMFFSANAFAVEYDSKYPDVEITPSSSETYQYGTMGAQLYKERKQLKLYNGTPKPGYDHEIWAVVEGMTISNTSVPEGSDSDDVRYPNPPNKRIYSINVTTAPPIAYYVFGDKNVIVAIEDVLIVTGLNIYYGETTSQIVETTIGIVNAAVIYSVNSGLITFFPVKDQAGTSILNLGRLKAILAADSFRF